MNFCAGKENVLNFADYINMESFKIIFYRNECVSLFTPVKT